MQQLKGFYRTALWFSVFFWGLVSLGFGLVQVGLRFKFSEPGSGFRVQVHAMSAWDLQLVELGVCISKLLGLRFILHAIWVCSFVFGLSGFGVYRSVRP